MRAATSGRGRGRAGINGVGDGLVPSRLSREPTMSGAGDHNAPARARGRPYGSASAFSMRFKAKCR